ncbi:MAG: hypothetical protein HKO65_10670, partial [Gemmatimonadetes bacterium]|nr:hypothetical protein [Gemmatimonadota bacterium]
MKIRAGLLTLALGLTVGLFACQDQSVVAPDDVMSPEAMVMAGVDCDARPDHPKCGGGGGDDGISPSLMLGGIDGVDSDLDGFSSTDVTSKTKKGIFSMHAPFYPVIKYTGGALTTDHCTLLHGPAVGPLLDAVAGPDFSEVDGSLTNIFFDENVENGTASLEHRIFVLGVEGSVVRYYQFGPWYNAEAKEWEHPATFVRTDDPDDGDVSTFTLTGGVLYLRDTEG